MENKKIKLSVRVTPKEHAHLKKQADNAGLKMEPFIRKLIMGTEIRPRPPDEYRRILFELSAIGNHVNQIAHIANAERHISTEKLNEAVAKVDRAISIVRRWN